MKLKIQSRKYKLEYFLKGFFGLFSIANLMSGISFFGFAVFCFGLGIYLYEILLMCLIVWALPAQIAMLTLYFAGAGIVAIVFAAAMTSVRLLFMTLDVMIQTRDNIKKFFIYYFIGHFITVTVWTEYNRITPDNKDMKKRPEFIVGLGLGQMTTMATATAIAFFIKDKIPFALEASFVIATPCFFLTVIFARAANKFDIITILLAIALMPLINMITNDFDLAISGILAATIIFPFAERKNAKN